jgi:23S rRNA (adenine-N6)-dimethyltransferase
LLTEALADAGFRVIAIEKDERLYSVLRARCARRPNVTCHHADFLTFPLPSTAYRAVSNVPYGITAALVRKLLHAARPPDDAVLIVQREAAEKFAGTPRETRFSLLHKPWFEISIAGAVRRQHFVPPPRVHSVLLRLRRREAPLIAARSGPAYRTFISTSFGQGAPEVSHALRRHLTARQIKRLGHDLGFSRDSRASQLSFGQWLSIFRFVEHECLGHDPTRCVASQPHAMRVAAVAVRGGRTHGSAATADYELPTTNYSNIFFGAPEGWRRKLWTSQRLKPPDSTSSKQARLGLARVSWTRSA